MSKFRDGMIGPTLILFIICLVMTAAVAGTYNLTAPIIEAQKQSALTAVEFEGMPPAGDFVEAPLAALPEGVTEAYMTEDGSHYIIKASAKGFGGPVTFIVGLDADGNYAGISMSEHTETAGIGTRVAEPEYLDKYYGIKDPKAVDAVSGATITSGALKASLELVNETYNAIKGA